MNKTYIARLATGMASIFSLGLVGGFVIARWHPAVGSPELLSPSTSHLPAIPIVLVKSSPDGPEQSPPNTGNPIAPSEVTVNTTTLARLVPTLGDFQFDEWLTKTMSPLFNLDQSEVTKLRQTTDLVLDEMIEMEKASAKLGRAPDGGEWIRIDPFPDQGERLKSKLHETLSRDLGRSVGQAAFQILERHPILKGFGAQARAVSVIEKSENGASYYMLEENWLRKDGEIAKSSQFRIDTRYMKASTERYRHLIPDAGEND